jgi:hypothetical protein
LAAPSSLATARCTSTHQPEGQRTWMMASTSCTRAPRLMPPMPLPARKGTSAAGKSRQQHPDSLQHKHGQRRQAARRVDRHGRPGSRTGLKDSLPPACGGISALVAPGLFLFIGGCPVQQAATNSSAPRFSRRSETAAARQDKSTPAFSHAVTRPLSPPLLFSLPVQPLASRSRSNTQIQDCWMIYCNELMS